MGKKKFGIMGNGYLAGIIVDGYLSGILDEYQLVGVMGRTPDKTAALAERGGCKACGTVEELLALKPDIVAEAASVQCIRDNAETVLSSGADLIVLSIGAFADKALYETIKETAREHDTKVHIASGAVGGFDVLRTVSLMGQAKSGICTRKGPASLKNTPLYDDGLMTEEEERQVFSGNAKEAVAASLATIGPEDTSVNIFSVPGMIGDDHKITAEIDGVKAVVDIYSSTSAIAGWSVVAVLKNLVSPIVF